jgi:hypothetical protein
MNSIRLSSLLDWRPSAAEFGSWKPKGGEVLGSVLGLGPARRTVPGSRFGGREDFAKVVHLFAELSQRDDAGSQLLVSEEDALP